MDRIHSIFNQQELSLKEKVIEILRLKNKKPIVILLNESRDQIAEIHEFNSYKEFDQYNSKLPGNLSLILVFKENGFFTAGAKLLEETWSYRIENDKIEMAHYEGNVYPLRVPLKELLFDLKKDILLKLSNTK
jgi:hypothetical protein